MQYKYNKTQNGNNDSILIELVIREAVRSLGTIMPGDPINLITDQNKKEVELIANNMLKNSGIVVTII